MSLSRILVVVFYIIFIGRNDSQVTIADALPGCLLITDAVAVECQMAGTFQFEIVGNQFVANNADGTDCGCPLDYGNNNAFFEFETVDISSFMNVSISFDYSAAAATYEDDSPGAPIVGCHPTPGINNSHDQIVFYYSLNGGPFVLGEYIHGTSQADFTGTWNETGLNGNTLKIRVVASNKATTEIFYFENLVIEGDPKPISAGPDRITCDTDPVTLNGSGTGMWSGGAGSFGSPNNAVTTYSPAGSEIGSTVTLTYSANPGTPGCAGTYPPPSDDVDVTVNSSPNASISGGGEICQGECTNVDINVTGGEEPFTLSFTVNGFPFNNIPGFSFNDQITVCLSQGNFPFPTYNQATNTLDLPANLSGTTLTFQFTNISDNSGCPGMVDNTPVQIDLLAKPHANPFTLEKCDEGGGQATFDLNDAVFDILGSETGTVHFYSDAGLSNEEFSPYVSGTGVLFAVIEGNNGCWSDPVNLNLEVLAPGNITPVSISCNGGPNCSICDDDGIIGEVITIQVNLPLAQGYLVELEYLINGVPNSLTQNVFGPVDDIDIVIDGDAIITLIGVTAAGECPDVSGLGPNVNIDYNLEPSVTNAVSLSNCDEITLPVINVINPGSVTAYFTGPGGTGTRYNAGDVITSTIQLYVFSGNANCFFEELILVNIGGTTTYDSPTNVSICGGFVLPVITGVNVSGTASYFTEINGGGTQYAVGDTVTSSTTLYVFDENNIGCQTNQPTFLVTITPSPQIQLDSIAQKCDQYKLPKITGTNLSGNEAYYSNPLFTGMPDSIGTLVMKNDTFYILAGTALCNDKDTLIIQIQTTSVYDEPLDINACNSYELPPISGINVGINAGYFSDTIDTAIQYQVGDIITGPLRLFVYDSTSYCESNSPEFNIAVSPGPEIFSINDTTSCEYFILPPINGNNLSGSEAYFDLPNGSGQQYNAGDTIFASQPVFAYETNVACATQQPFDVTIDQKAKSGNALNVQICLEGDLTLDLFNLLTGTYEATGNWTLTNSGLITIDDPTAVLIPGNLPTDVYRFRYVVDGGSCGLAVSLPNAIIIQMPNAGLDSIYQVCEGSSTGVNLYNLLRSASSLGGTWISVPSNPDPSNLDVSSYPIGDYQFRYAVANRYLPTNSSCNDTSLITIRVIDGLNAGNDVVFGQVCENSTVDLTTLINNNTSLGQFKNKANGAVINTPQNFRIPNGANNNLIVQHILPSTNGCDADTSELRFTVLAKPNAGNDNGNNYCGNQTIELLSLVENGALNGTFIANGNSLVITNNEINPTLGGSYSFYYSVGNGLICPKDTAEITVDFIPNPLFELNANQNLCQGADFELLFNNNYSGVDPSIDITFNIVTDQNFQNGVLTGIENTITIPANVGNNYTYTNNALDLPVGTYHIVANIEEGSCNFDNYSGSFDVVNGGSKIINTRFCADETVTLYGNNYSIINAKDTLLITSPSGCDSTIFIDLRFNPTATSNVTLDICEGKTQSFNDTDFNSESTGGQVVLFNQSSNGCDSIINVSVKKLLNRTGNYVYATCNNNYSVQIGNSIFNQGNASGTALMAAAGSNGCDSIVNVSLSFIVPNSELVTSDALCENADGLVSIEDTDLNGEIDVYIDGVLETSFDNVPFQFSLPQGSYEVELRDVDGCATKESIVIMDSEAPVVSVKEIVQSDGSKRLIIQSDVPLSSVQWTPSGNVDCDDCEDVLVLIYGPLSVMYEFGQGCSDTLSYTVFENVEEIIYFPNIINLNSGVNNVFFPQKPEGYFVRALSMSIFDRWGNKVFYNSDFEIGDITEGWDGKFNGTKLNPGVYVFTLQIVDGNGNTKYYTGDVTLVD